MKKRQLLRRGMLADQLQELALRLRSSDSICVGATSGRLPENVEVEINLDVRANQGEFLLEVAWPTRELEKTPLVGILTGSPHDIAVVKATRDTLTSLGVSCEVRVLSAHRTPDLTVQYVRNADQRGIEVIVACAGMANHLAGIVAAHTTLPVIGIPLVSGKLGGMDSLLSTVQMPPGVPVATVAIDGSKNGAFLAARILGLKYPEIQERLKAYMANERERYQSISSDDLLDGTTTAADTGK